MSEAKVEKIKEAAHKIIVRFVLVLPVDGPRQLFVGLVFCDRSRNSGQTEEGYHDQYRKQISRWDSWRSVVSAGIASR
jgi:hypothetical protein